MSRAVNNFIVRLPKTRLLIGLAIMSRAVECAFLATGAAAAAYAGLQSIAIVMRWVGVL
jgi:hypothetical protein